MHSADQVTVRIRLSGWLSSYFDRAAFTLETTPFLQEAIPDLLSQVTGRAHSPLPHGGMHILVNGTQAQALVAADYVLKPDDEITLVPVVAGGCWTGHRDSINAYAPESTRD